MKTPAARQRGLFWAWAAILLAATSLAGCAAGNDPPLRISSDDPDQRAYEKLWTACQDVLMRYGFVLDRQDRWAGVITTQPLTGKSIMEFWRRDAATGADAWESTLQTIYRKAEVQIRRDPASGYYPFVIMMVSRSERPEQQITSDSEAQAMFRRSTISRQRQELERPVQTADPVPVGEDAMLAIRISAEIVAQAQGHTTK